MAAGALKLETEARDGVLLIHVSGPLDSANYEQFKQYMDPLVKQPHVRIVLDCEFLTYVNSRAWTLLMHYHRSAVLGLSNFQLAAFGTRPLKGIRLLGLGRYLKWSPTVDKAVQTAVAI